MLKFESKRLVLRLSLEKHCETPILVADPDLSDEQIFDRRQQRHQAPFRRHGLHNSVTGSCRREFSTSMSAVMLRL